MKPTLEELEDRDDWKVPKIVAEMWHCGDDVCDCWQPQISLILPRLSFPIIERFEIWSGTFQSGPDFGEMQEMRKELRDEAGRMGIMMDEEFEEHGIREATQDEITKFKHGNRRS